MASFAERISADKWDGARCDDVEILQPTAGDVERCLNDLDDAIRTIVTLDGPGGSYLTVGGGQGRYIVFASPSQETFWNLINEDAEKASTVLLNCGGQQADYPARQVVDMWSALQAARTFFFTGKRDPSLSWELQQYPI